MTLLPPPRAWVDWAVPKDKNGDDIGTASNDDGTYELYLNWLADYLYETDIPVPECQKDVIAEYRSKGGADHAFFDLSERIGYTIWDVDGIERDFGEGKSWEDFHAHERSCWDEFSKEEQEEQTEEEYFIWKDEYERIGREGQERKVVPSHIRHSDIPYRAVVAALFKDVPKHSCRYHMLHRFYSVIDENASK